MFGQAIIGPPGSGKSTYCKAMKDFLEGMGRKVKIINLDPANDCLPYESSVDIQELVTVEDVMEELSLGPNGALIHCMEYLDANSDWLKDKLNQLQSQNQKSYILMDLPGQVELYTHNDSVKNILRKIQKSNHRIVVVHLTDSHSCSDPGKFVSVLLNCLAGMIQLECPQINILSKIDIIEKFGPLPFSLEFFTEVLDLSQLLQLLQEDPHTKKYQSLNKAICEVIENYSLVSFYPLNITDKYSMGVVMGAADKANGFCFGDAQEKHSLNTMMGLAMKESKSEFVQNIQDRYFSPPQENAEESSDS